MKTPIISIIIPTFNRAHLIAETLDSLLAQTYQNWECIVVDDGSTDYTLELLGFYCEKDSRIQFHHRPKNRRKGANTCRNYGFELSKGKYIQWFDSDDLMLPIFLEIKVKAISENDIAFVVSKTANFEDPDLNNIISNNEKHYEKYQSDLDFKGHIFSNSNWHTVDFLGERNILENIRFNINLRSSQERNFFSKLNFTSHRGKFIDEIVTLRRIHKDSIQSKIIKNKTRRVREELEFYYETLKDLNPTKQSLELDHLFNEAVTISMLQKLKWEYIIGLTLEFFKRKAYKTGVWYFFYQSIFKITGRGNILRNILKENLKKVLKRYEF